MVFLASTAEAKSFIAVLNPTDKGPVLGANFKQVQCGTHVNLAAMEPKSSVAAGWGAEAFAVDMERAFGKFAARLLQRVPGDVPMRTGCDDKLRAFQDRCAPPAATIDELPVDARRKVDKPHLLERYHIKTLDRNAM